MYNISYLSFWKERVVRKFETNLIISLKRILYVLRCIQVKHSSRIISDINQITTGYTYIYAQIYETITHSASERRGRERQPKHFVPARQLKTGPSKRQSPLNFLDTRLLN